MGDVLPADWGCFASWHGSSSRSAEPSNSPTALQGAHLRKGPTGVPVFELLQRGREASSRHKKAPARPRASDACDALGLAGATRELLRVASPPIGCEVERERKASELVGRAQRLKGAAAGQVRKRIDERKAREARSRARRRREARTLRERADEEEKVWRRGARVM